MIDPDLLKILCCPESRQPLTELDAGRVDALNQAIAEGRLKNRAGQPVRDKLDGALIRADGQFAYPIRDGIPVLLVDEAIPVTQ